MYLFSAVFSDYSLASFITGIFAVISILLAYLLKNKRTMKKVTAEEYIENFMRRELEHKNEIIKQMETTVQNYDMKIKDMERKDFQKTVVIKELKLLNKELKTELLAVKRQAKRWKTELDAFHKRRI